MSVLRGLFAGIRAVIGMVKEGKELFETAEGAAVECGMEGLPPILF